MLTALPWMAGWLACSDPTTVDSEPQDSAADTDTAADTGPYDTTGLYGEEVLPRLEAPTFSQVLASDGTARTQADLMGHPTVIWFYPDAGTYG